MDTEDLQETIDAAFEDGSWDKRKVRKAVGEALDGLDAGELRVAEHDGRDWVVNEWLKRAILLSFRQREMETIEVGPFEYHDKVPLKGGFEKAGVRVVPPAVVRHGAHVERGAVLMPSYTNIGAYVSGGTMVDTWATVGSCAQIGRNVHLAGGVGIGGVLEPPSARPIIVEDEAFIGSRCVVTEGVIVEQGAVLGTGVNLSASIPVIDVTASEPITYRGRVPAWSVVIPGTRLREFTAGTYGVPCALIIGHRDEATDTKVSLNDALREHDVPIQ
ncbi:2,3,4,5-tetrahydropyridine-2,6-dicarboxylate N-succinyltransferase [Egibacter rhizosphaerae]|uniref:2,3,4,5-tetrahydropyridine-2,6-dicarboxylate N-succinyltransferase n=1 Tax=Egibacter rhizosphaerae TaxID=1670831 RepID=UPI00197A9128|nr:2,3,4,5-tetrahydropyridine-2,6-dicarboxylate N-succinyltransferase [Egibacter rhizosphaerae]